MRIVCLPPNFRTIYIRSSSFYDVVVQFRHGEQLVVNVERRKRDLFILKLITNQSITLISNNEGLKRSFLLDESSDCDRGKEDGLRSVYYQ